MATAKEQLKKLQQGAKNDPVGAKAAEVLASTNSDPGDPPSETGDPEMDFDFINYDPTDVAPYFKKLDLPIPTGVKMRWVETDTRVYNKRMAQGWKPVADGKIRNGSQILCSMPEAKHKRWKQIMAQKNADRMNAPMRRFDQEVRARGGKHFEPFDGPRSVRDGLD